MQSLHTISVTLHCSSQNQSPSPSTAYTYSLDLMCVCPSCHKHLALFTFKQVFLQEWPKQDYFPHRGFIFPTSHADFPIMGMIYVHVDSYFKYFYLLKVSTLSFYQKEEVLKETSSTLECIISPVKNHLAKKNSKTIWQTTPYTRMLQHLRCQLNRTFRSLQNTCRINTRLGNLSCKLHDKTMMIDQNEPSFFASFLISQLI